MPPSRSGNRAVVLAGAVLLAACSTPPRMDLRHNPSLYQPTGYAAAVAADRAAFVAPVVDERVPPQDAGQLPITYLSDRDWERPAPMMLHEILRDELRASGVFKEVLDTPRPDALMIKPVLRAFDGGVQEELYGRRSLAHVGLQIDVFGPEFGGERKLLLSQPFFERPVSPPGFKPPSPRALLGFALHATMSKLVGTVDASNVSRSAVVTDADLRKQ
jgi:hypothetical protein